MVAAMGLPYQPRAGDIFICEFPTCFEAPEMVKTRAVIVVSPRVAGRGSDLATVVPISEPLPTFAVIITAEYRPVCCQGSCRQQARTDGRSATCCTRSVFVACARWNAVVEPATGIVTTSIRVSISPPCVRSGARSPRESDLMCRCKGRRRPFVHRLPLMLKARKTMAPPKRGRILRAEQACHRLAGPASVTT